MRLIDADKLKKTMMKYYGCENATKYGNETAEQQAHSYSTLMLYEVSDMIEDCIDNAPTVDMNTELSVAYLKGRRQGQSDERPTGKCIDFDDYSKWLKGQAIVGFDYNRCDVLIERNGIWENAIETYLKERSEEE